MTGVISYAILALSTLPIIIKIQKIWDLILDRNLVLLFPQNINSFICVFDQVFEQFVLCSYDTSIYNTLVSVELDEGWDSELRQEEINRLTLIVEAGPIEKPRESILDWRKLLRVYNPELPRKTTHFWLHFITFIWAFSVQWSQKVLSFDELVQH